MGAIHNYLGLHKELRATLVFAGFAVASFAVYAAISLGYIGVEPRPNILWDRVLPPSFLLLALLSDLGIVWILHQPRRRGLWSTFVLVSAAIIVGAILASVAIWREHWIEMVGELFRSTSMTR
jgi:hypothetical protein